MGKLHHKGLNRVAIIAIATLISALVVYLREPSIFLHPQFWGEDGKYWYGQAYNHGPFLTLFWSYASSLQLAMRLVGSLSLLLPISAVPLFFALIAAGIQILPPVLLFTDRFSKLFGSYWLNALVAIFYLLIPNSFEVHANLTNINWHLALLAFMVLAAPITNRRWRYFDYAVLLIGGLTGPFSILLLPAAYIYWRQKNIPKAYLGIVTATATLQAVTYLISDHASRLTQGLGASPLNFLVIIGGRISGALLLSMESVSGSITEHKVRFAVLGALTIAFLIYAAIRGPLNLKLFLLFAWLMFLSALAKPQASATLPQWQAMIQGAGNRYFFIPMISIFISLIWAAKCKPKLFKIPAIIALLMIFTFGINDFSYQAKPYKNFSDSAKQLGHSKSGQIVCLDVNPSPDWRTCLKKH